MPRADGGSAQGDPGEIFLDNGVNTVSSILEFGHRLSTISRRCALERLVS